MSSSDRSWILQYTENSIIPTNTKMLTVSKVLILRATAMKGEYCLADSVKPVKSSWVVASFVTLQCVLRRGDFCARWREGQLAETRRAGRSVQHHGQLRSGTPHRSHRTYKVGNVSSVPGARLQPASDAFMSFTSRQTAALASPTYYKREMTPREAFILPSSPRQLQNISPPQRGNSPVP